MDAVTGITSNGATGTELFNDDEIYEHQVIQVYFVGKFGFVVVTVHESRCVRELCNCVLIYLLVTIQGSVGFVLHVKCY